MGLFSSLLRRVRLRVVRLCQTRLQRPVEHLLVSHRNLFERDLNALGLVAVVAGNAPARYHGIIKKQLQVNPGGPARQPTPFRFKSDGTGDKLAIGTGLEERRTVVLDGK